MTSQLVPRCRAASLMVMCRDSSRAERLEGPGIALSPGGKIDLDLTQNPTQQTQAPLDRHLVPDGLGAYGERAGLGALPDPGV